ncbi:glycosyltransferase family 2 protein [Pseudofrancisella aestuarii]|uniref:Glycosyltransferase family 2 protein n=1 Tax=Pseudofrancisella aestuarii TaxID=2670347 RepID=A0ABV9TBC2_9GAMM|nr:glycosyltransferase family 2 protein [Pseudofrancisella aestuarii]
MLNKEIRPEILLSIIIPHYKTYELLIKLLKTIPDKPSIEVIIVDDLSNDSRLKSLEGFFENVKFNLILNDYHSNAGHCRNVGLSLASGKWLFFVDSDDFFLPNFYLSIEPYFYSTYEVVFFMVDSCDTYNVERKTFRGKYVNKIILNYKNNPSIKSELELRYGINSIWNKLISREFLVKNDIVFEEINAANDVMFSTLVGNKMKKYYVSGNSIYMITSRSDSLTKIFSEENFECRLSAHIRKGVFLKKEGIKDPYIIIKLGYLLNLSTLHHSKKINKALSRVKTLNTLRKCDLLFHSQLFSLMLYSLKVYFFRVKRSS